MRRWRSGGDDNVVEVERGKSDSVEDDKGKRNDEEDDQKVKS